MNNKSNTYKPKLANIVLASATENDSGIRLDIQGIRALAILLVVFAHTGVPGLAGGFIGIDVFFVVSGFLITGLLVREAEKNGKISLRAFYARRARRLLPMAAVVLLFTAVVSLLLYPPTDQIKVGQQIVGAAFYFVNWIFAFQEVNYFNAGFEFVSPVMHFWSLSVEEQFYLTWPLLMIPAVFIARRTRSRVRSAFLVLLVPVAFFSLAYSVLETASNPEVAYFSTLTRIWELAFGAILAILLPRSIGIARWLAVLLVGGGLLVIVATALLVDDGSPFPGWQALLPVLATCSVLIGGTGRNLVAPLKLLCLRPAQYIGDISYAWYLWHWPIITFALVLWPEINLPTVITIGFLSMIPAAISHSLIENPVRRSKMLRRFPVRAILVGGVASTVAATAGVALAKQETAVKIVSDAPGAKVVQTPGRVPFAKKINSIMPDPLRASLDRGDLFYDGCMLWEPKKQEHPKCTYGNPDSKTSVVLFGDSKPMSWFPAVEPIAEKRDWKLVGLTRGNCVLSDITYEEVCDSWREEMMQRIPREKPDLILLGTATKSMYRAGIDGKQLSRRASEPYLVRGMIRLIDRLKQTTDARIVVIRDQPLLGENMPECVSDNIKNIRKCAFVPKRPTAKAFDLKAARKAGVDIIDPTPMFCSKKICPPVIGNVLVNQDGYHVTATYAKTMSPWMEKEILRVKGVSK